MNNVVQLSELGLRTGVCKVAFWKKGRERAFLSTNGSERLWRQKDCFVNKGKETVGKACGNELPGLANICSRGLSS